MLVVHGNHEAFTHNHRLVAELLYAMKRFRLKGGESCDASFALMLKGYINGLDLYYEREWCSRLYQQPFQGKVWL